mmetsp:Transcript_59806/g.192494  ORF Transcript_59806/g.192494 Transcript_59806/m.192494 type:complete len:202 (+) Transcript_59806:389-994(+)
MSACWGSRGRHVRGNPKRAGGLRPCSAPSVLHMACSTNSKGRPPPSCRHRPACQSAARACGSATSRRSRGQCSPHRRCGFGASTRGTSRPRPGRQARSHCPSPRQDCPAGRRPIHRVARRLACRATPCPPARCATPGARSRQTALPGPRRATGSTAGAGCRALAEDRNGHGPPVRHVCQRQGPGKREGPGQRLPPHVRGPR